MTVINNSRRRGTSLAIPLLTQCLRVVNIVLKDEPEGIELEVGSGVQLTLDAFRIDIDDRIGISESLQGEALIDTVQNLPGGEGVRSVSYFTNAIDTRTDGLELVADWNGTWASGQYSRLQFY